MNSTLDEKRFRYKTLRASFFGKDRDEWRKKEFSYSNYSTPLTPDQWLIKLEDWVAKKQFIYAYQAWLTNRKSNPFFWGGALSPSIAIKNYTLVNSRAQKTILLKQQLASDILLETTYQHSESIEI
jgi:hypothetical protein